MYYYNAISRNSKFDEDSRVIYSRHCVSENKEVDEETEACARFNLSKYIFCKKYEYWLLIDVCRNRIDIKFEGCSRCGRGKLVKSIVETGD